jgi:hypothetical protein
MYQDNLALRAEIKRLKSDITHFKAEANRATMDMDKRDRQLQDILERDKSSDPRKDASFIANIGNSPDVSAKLREVRDIFI